MLSVYQTLPNLSTIKSNEYPDDQRVLALRLNECLSSRNYDAAIDLAKRVKLPFDEALARAFAKGTLEHEPFVEEARALGKSDRAWLALAMEACHRAMWVKAQEWISNVPLEGSLGIEAAMLRFRLIGERIKSGAKPDASMINELLVLLPFVATKPQEKKLRFACEEVFFDNAEEVISKILFRYVIESFYAQLFEKINEEGYTLKKSVLGEGELADPDVALAWFDNYLKEHRNSEFVFGRGELSAALLSSASPALVRALYYIVGTTSYSADDPEGYRRFELPLLQSIALLGKAMEDPGVDYHAARTLISRFSVTGGMQAARNIAETTVMLLPAVQPNLLRWRLSQGWFCLAEAFIRSHQPLQGLYNIALGLSILENPEKDGDLWFGLLRLTARAFRDSGSIKTARLYLEFELQERQQNGWEDSIQLEQFKLLLDILEVSVDTPNERLHILLNRCLDLLRENDGDAGPIISCLGNIISLLKKRGEIVLEDAMRAFDQGCAQVVGYTATLMNLATKHEIGRDEVLAAVISSAEAEQWDDLAHQMAPLERIMRKAINHACESKDAELFVLASTVLSQPVASLKASSLPSSTSNYERALNRRMEAVLSDRHMPAEEQHAFLRRAQAHVPRFARTATSLTQIKISDFQSVLRDDEAALLISRTDADRGARIWLTHSKIELPVLEDQSSQHHANLDESSAVVSLNSLHCISLISVRCVIILPDAERFAQAFVLKLDGNTSLSSNVIFFVAPSLLWLAWQCQNPWRGKAEIIAWLGARDHPDRVLKLFRLESRPVLRNLGVRLSDSEAPSELAGSAVAIVGVHGRPGLLHPIATVTDMRRSLAPRDLVSLLEGCGCVVLCVCSGGYSSATAFSTEAQGIVPELLAAGTRAVVAPLSPISIQVATQWLETFVHCIRSGDSVGKAAQTAQRNLSQPSPMRVFGDGQFCPIVPAEIASSLNEVGQPRGN